MAKNKADMSAVPEQYLNPATGRYLPGHDAKHVSELLADLKNEAQVSSKDGKIKVAALRAAQKALPTPALREKLAKAVDRFNNPPARPATPKAEKPAPEDTDSSEGEPVDDSALIRVEEQHDVKVGRWFYPARRAILDDGTEQVQRNTARDGSGEWVVYDG